MEQSKNVCSIDGEGVCRESKNCPFKSSKFPKNKKESKMVTTVLAIVYIALALTVIPAVIDSAKKQEDTMTGFMSALFFVFSATAYIFLRW
jgi:hypothetical protein